MKIIGKNSLSSYVKILLDCIFTGGILIYLTLPVCLKWYLSNMYTAFSKDIYIYLLIMLYITGIFALFIVYEIQKIFKTLKLTDPFIKQNVKSFKHISIMCFLIAISYFTKIFILNSFMTIITVMVFTIVGLFSVIIAYLFDKAVDIKTENDFTI